VTDAALVVALANARAVRRPTSAAVASVHDSLRDPESAGELLSPFLGHPLDARELEQLRELQQVVANVVDAIIDRSSPPLDALNALAAREPTVCALELGPDRELVRVLRPARPTAVGTLLPEAIRELAALDPSRLRFCARRECRLVFYDATRSGTQRWHAERPCGLRERQRRHRAKRLA
jgi:predicted RNA-binding Zn ribbon-like protein